MLSLNASPAHPAAARFPNGRKRSRRTFVARKSRFVIIQRFRYNALPFFYLARNKRMPAPAPADDRKVSLVHQRLVETYGRLTLAPGGDPLDELIGTILSQNTSDVNSGRAYAHLRTITQLGKTCLTLRIHELYEAIKLAGLGRIKAPRIKNTLREILKRRGD